MGSIEDVFERLNVFANPICPIIALLACPRITLYTVTIENTRERKNPKEPFDLTDHSLELTTWLSYQNICLFARTRMKIFLCGEQ